MEIRKKPGTFADLNPGDVFIRGDNVYLRVIVEGKDNAINLQTGYGTWIASATEVAKVACEISIDY